MKNFSKTFVVLFIIGQFSVQAQTVQYFGCNYLLLSGSYTCQLREISIPDNENVEILIGGQHLPNFGNLDVLRVQLFDSNVPFVPTQLFTVFTNLRNIFFRGSGLNRIQTNAFSNAKNLETAVFEASALTTIHANAFSGAVKLQTLDFWENQLQSVHESAFVGLSSLRSLYLDNNQIQQLHFNVFSPLLSLEKLVLNSNRLEVLDGRLIANNSLLLHLEISLNQINAIGRSFLDNTPSLALFGALNNRCISRNFRIGGSTTLENVRVALATCFENFDNIA